MFGKMKKMLKDEEGTGILAGVGGAIAGCLPGGIGVALLGPCNLCCPPICPAVAVCGGALGGALGGLGGFLLDYIAMGAACIGTTMSACLGSVGSCINFIPLLMGGK